MTEFARHPGRFTGLRPDPFPDQAASLLPGFLTAIRTGLTPVSGDALTTKDHLHKVTSSLLVARKIEADPESLRYNPPDARTSAELGEPKLYAAVPDGYLVTFPTIAWDVASGA